MTGCYANFINHHIENLVLFYLHGYLEFYCGYKRIWFEKESKYSDGINLDPAEIEILIKIYLDYHCRKLYVDTS